MSQDPDETTQANERLARKLAETLAENERLTRELADARRERDNALSDYRQADTDSIRALHERNEARTERDLLAEILRHAVQRVQDYENYISGTRANPPSTRAFLDYAEKTLASITPAKP
jgi:septal ring factor EnvC (AmiA/AmiB activator)